jgi:hypothetical protein
MAQPTFFLYGSSTGEIRIEVDHDTLTGAQIKTAIKANDPAFDPTHDLILEGQGHDADKVIADTDTVNLAIGHGQGPKKFFSRPPTNFGG